MLDQGQKLSLIFSWPVNSAMPLTNSALKMQSLICNVILLQASGPGSIGSASIE